MEEECLLIALLYIERLVYSSTHTPFQSFDYLDSPPVPPPPIPSLATSRSDNTISSAWSDGGEMDGGGRGGLQLTSLNWKAVVLTAMLLASKVWDDFSMVNADFVVIMGQRGSTITLERLAELESAMLDLLQYRMMVTGPEYAQVHFRLQDMVARIMACKSREGLRQSGDGGMQSLDCGGVCVDRESRKMGEGESALRRLLPMEEAGRGDAEPSAKRSRDGHMSSGSSAHGLGQARPTATTPLLYAMSMTDANTRTVEKIAAVGAVGESKVAPAHSGQTGVSGGPTLDFTVHAQSDDSSSAIVDAATALGALSQPSELPAGHLASRSKNWLVGKCWNIVSGWLE